MVVGEAIVTNIDQKDNMVYPTKFNVIQQLLSENVNFDKFLLIQDIQILRCSQTNYKVVFLQ